MIWIGLLSILLALAILYWLFILSEGVYLGQKAVIALYDWGAPSYDRIKQVQPHHDAQHLAGPLMAALLPKTSAPQHPAAPPLPKPRRSGVEYLRVGVPAPPKRDGVPVILEVATGTGRLPLALLRQWDFHGRVVGLDLSRKMLSVARHRTAAQLHRVGLIREDALALPFPDGCFDAVTCIEALEFLPNPWAALREMARVLRPGGQLLISNRAGTDALFFPGHVCRTRDMEDRLHALDLVDVNLRRWQVHYDLIEAKKPEQEPGTAPPPINMYGAAGHSTPVGAGWST